MIFATHRFPGSGCVRPSLIVAALTLACAVVMVTAPVAEASKGWCRTDPVVVLDGEVADIWVASTLDAFTVATGPTQLVVTVPRGVTTDHIISDLGFGHGYDVRFAESSKLRRTATGIAVEIAVYVPATDDDLPILVEFAPRVVGILAPASAEGTANDWIVLRTAL